MDRLSTAKRSWNMSRIRGRDTVPERVVRSMLHRMGYRFRLHDVDLPGKPDIVFSRYHCAIFVHGCFWHRHPQCKYAYTPKSRQDFWEKKFCDNVARDLRNVTSLEELGWHSAVIWECETTTPELLARRITTVFRELSIPLRSLPPSQE